MGHGQIEDSRVGQEEAGLYMGRRGKEEGTVEWRGDTWLSRLRGGRFQPVERCGPSRKSR